jgi:hypothetical protein
VVGKKHAEKEGKPSCERKINVVRRHASLTMIGLWFLIRIVMAISLSNSINKNLRGLGKGCWRMSVNGGCQLERDCC